MSAVALLACEAPFTEVLESRAHAVRANVVHGSTVRVQATSRFFKELALSPGYETDEKEESSSKRSRNGGSHASTLVAKIVTGTQGLGVLFKRIREVSEELRTVAQRNRSKGKTKLPLGTPSDACLHYL